MGFIKLFKSHYYKYDNDIVPKVTIMLKDGCVINELDNSGNNILMLFIGLPDTHGNFQIIQEESTKISLLLIENGININISNYYGTTPIHKAVYSENLDLIKLLISKGISQTINKMDLWGRTPIHYTDDISIKNLLIAAGADPNLQRGEYQKTKIQTILQAAHFLGRVETSSTSNK